MLRIYKSSAGSGKTYTLVSEYLRLALGADPYHFKHILALTFTNKAANEMKQRILSTLRQIATMDSDSPLTSSLCESLQITPDVLKTRAAQLLTNIIHAYSDLSVSTIDSFVHRIIRTFAYDLHLPGNFEIEMDKDELLRHAIDRLMDQVGEEGSTLVTKALNDFIASTMSDGKGWNIEGKLIRFAAELFKEEAYTHIQQLSAYTLKDFISTRDRLLKIKADFEREIQAPAIQAMSLIRAAGIEASNFYQGTRGIYKYFLQLAEQPEVANTIPNSFVNKTIEETKWSSSKIDILTRDAIWGLIPALTDSYNQILTIRERSESDYTIACALIKNIYSFMLLTEIHRMMEEHKRKNNILHISEFQQRISQIVSEQEAPIIYERIGDRYDSILIDEFQDTSLLQWRNLLPLVENSQVKQGDSLIVGDAKQAIYRFRGGQVEQFVALPEVYGSEESAILKERENVIVNYGYELHHLDHNYRSRLSIIEFNNSLYEHLQAHPDFAYKDIYENHTQQSDPKKTGGYISIDFVAEEMDRPYQDTLHEKVESLIHHARSHQYDWRDIAILTRSNVKGSAIAAYLSGRGIPIISSESLLLVHAIEVRRMISVCYYLADRNAVIRRAELLYYLWSEVLTQSPTDMDVYMSAPYRDFERWLSEHTGVAFDSNSLLRYRLPDMVLQLYATFGWRGRDHAYLQFFADMVADYAARHGNKIEEFLDWWEAHKHSQSITYPESLNAIRILTIHKAKGLQYPVVIAPEMDGLVKKSKDLIWTTISPHIGGDILVFPLACTNALESTPYQYLYEQEKQESLLDFINTYYVATTRPEDRLYIVCQLPKKNSEGLTNGFAIWQYYLQQQGLWEDGKTNYEIGDPATSKLNILSTPTMPEWKYQETMPRLKNDLPLRHRSKSKPNE